MKKLFRPKATNAQKTQGVNVTETAIKKCRRLCSGPLSWELAYAASKLSAYRIRMAVKVKFACIQMRWNPVNPDAKFDMMELEGSLVPPTSLSASNLAKFDGHRRRSDGFPFFVIKFQLEFVIHNLIKDLWINRIFSFAATRLCESPCLYQHGAKRDVDDRSDRIVSDLSRTIGARERKQ